MDIDKKKHFYDKMPPWVFVRYTKKKWREHKRRGFFIKLKNTAPIWLGIVFYIWQLFDWNMSDASAWTRMDDELIKTLIQFLYLFLAYPAYILVKGFNLSDNLGDRDQGRYLIVIFNWILYAMMGIFLIIEMTECLRNLFA
jgi:hypothetical protein